jgi:4-hydroxy-tetrahydrodipicolinate synthase
MNTLKGTGVALATPFDENNAIDYPGLENLYHHVVDGGVEYLVVMGTTGESPTVSWKEKLEILNQIIEWNKGSKPVVFGLGGNNTADLIQKLEEFRSLKIDAILSASPYYNKPSQKGLIAHYTALADHSAFPIVLYNVPGRTASNIDADTTLELSKHKNIVAIKEASGDLGQVSKILADKDDDFMLLSGEDQLSLPIISLGGEGVISVAANAYPREFSDMVRAALSDDFQKAKRLHLSLNDYFEWLTEEGNPTSVKAALEALSICRRTVRLPLAEASDALVSRFRRQ